MKRTTVFTIAIVIAACLPASAQAPSGAIFTTIFDGSEVNVNQFASKPDVYLDGGPGPGAPATAAGLDDGIYVFQVTDPSGKNLLSTDPAQCRQFSVSGGVITSVAPSGGCAHHTDFDVDHSELSALTVQLIPYNDTPNPGGVYKAWVTLATDYACYPNLSQVNCTAGGKHGFLPAFSKTDNFKVKQVPIREIDTFFIDSSTGSHLSGLHVTWVDTVAVSNRKWSYFVSFWKVTEAHVEAVEDGAHQIIVEDQPGCTVGDVYLRNEVNGYKKVTETYLGSGPQVVTVVIKNPNTQNHFVKVFCNP